MDGEGTADWTSNILNEIDKLILQLKKVPATLQTYIVVVLYIFLFTLWDSKEIADAALSERKHWSIRF